MSARVRLTTLVVATVCYVASMFLPLLAVNIFGPSPPCLGYLGFLVGIFAIGGVWSGELLGLLLFASWLANPAFLAGLGFLIAHKPVKSFWAGLAGFGLALTVLPSMRDELTQWPAYWVWLAGFAVLAIGSAVCAIAQRRQQSVEIEFDPRSEQITASPAPRSTP